MAKAIMLQGTSSHVGKSVLTAALCRIFYQDGHRVVPFKAQNMALNSYITKDGGEMGRAQVAQAEAAGLEPMVEMNPILLKPTGNTMSQVIMLGKAVRNMSAREYHQGFSTRALGVIADCLAKFHKEYDVIVIEGAGSPAEVNLKANDIVNMRVAKMAPAPVLLVADIDRGGALASVVGTLELLEPDERDLVAGIIINKFRGDIELLRPALDFLAAKTGKPVLGVVPYFEDFRIADEDSVSLDGKKARIKRPDQVDIAVIRTPKIANFTDFDPLEDEPDVNLRYVEKGQRIGRPDLVILPGSKNTVADLAYIKQEGYAQEIYGLIKKGIPVLGICGGYQMLGRTIHDPNFTESLEIDVFGLGLLNTFTIFYTEKTTHQVEAECAGVGFFNRPLPRERIKGYEIHMGKTQFIHQNQRQHQPAFYICRRSHSLADVWDGVVSEDGLVMGTYIHGIFDNDWYRRAIVNQLRERKGLAPLPASAVSTEAQKEYAYNRLAEVVRKSLNMDKLYEIVGLAPGEGRTN